MPPDLLGERIWGESRAGRWRVLEREAPLGAGVRHFPRHPARTSRPSYCQLRLIEPGRGLAIRAALAFAAPPRCSPKRSRLGRHVLEIEARASAARHASFTSFGGGEPPTRRWPAGQAPACRSFSEGRSQGLPRRSVYRLVLPTMARRRSSAAAPNMSNITEPGSGAAGAPPTLRVPNWSISS